jgi:hypothetical protein
MFKNLEFIILVSLVEIKLLVKYLAQGDISFQINSEEFSAAFFHQQNVKTVAYNNICLNICSIPGLNFVGRLYIYIYIVSN